MQGNNVNWLVNKLARVPSEWEGLARELSGARVTLADLKREQDGLVAEGLSLRNDITKIADKLSSVADEHNGVVRSSVVSKIASSMRCCHCGTTPQSWQTSWQG
jgi:hypothetical protein